MDLLGKASEFHDFLHSLAASSKRPCDQVDCFQVYDEDYAVTVLPVGTATPFNDFTGQLEGFTVVFSKFEATRTQLPNNELGLSVLDTLPSSIAGECSVDEHSQICFGKDKFPCISYQAVNVGQPLSQKRIYLTQSTPLHSGNTGYLVTDSTIAYDTGLIPLSLGKARYIASLYALGSRQARSKLPNMWVICKDKMRDIVALGCSHALNAVGKGLFKSFMVTAEDVLAETQLSSSEKHGVKSKGKLSGGGDYFVFSEYEIANCAATVVNDTEEKLAGDLTVQFAWNSPDAVLCPPSEAADAVVKISATPGYLFSPGLATYNELNTLLHLCEIAVGKSTWSSLSEGVDEEEAAKSSIKPLSDKVTSFLEDVSSPIYQPAEVNVVSPTSENKVYEARKDLDFAERLWLFAKDATSLEDLQQIFAEVFKAVLLGRVQPFVHRSSTSALSSLLRKVLLAPNMDERQDLAPKFQNLLTESKICVCLIQLGIEKMTRDYRAFFIGADVATGDQLDQFISASQSSQLEVCHTLCKLHCILELMSSALSFLKLPPPALSALFKSALEVYKEKAFVGFSTTPVFSLPLPAYSSAHKSLISFCSSLSPKKWVLSQQKTNNSSSGSVKRTVTVYRRQPLLQNLAEMELEDESRYYVYKAHCECI